MTNPKFGKGDTVRITHNSCYHGFEIGEIVTISSMTDWDSYFGYGNDGENGHLMTMTVKQSKEFYND